MYKLQEHFPTKFRTMAQAVSRRPLTAEALARSQASPRGTRAYFSDPLKHADRILREILEGREDLPCCLPSTDTSIAKKRK